MSCRQCAELKRALDLQIETVAALSAQVMRLGQCVVCGELGEQDGIRKDDEFRCVRCAHKSENGQWVRIDDGEKHQEQESCA